MLALVLAATLACGDLCTAEAASHYADLLARGGYGRLPVEYGGFLVRGSDDALTFIPWPRGGFQRAGFQGVIPAGALAIVHTHPRELPDPSAHDAKEARRLGLPVVVVTPRAVTVAWPDGERGVIQRGENASPRLRN